MNDFEENIKRDAEDSINKRTEELFNSIEKADNQEKALIAAAISLFLKKRKNMQDMINASKRMDMFLSLIKESAGDKIPEGLPDNSETIKQGEEVIAAIDNLIEAIQKYGIANDKFNDIVRTDVAEKDAYQKRLNGMDD